jgi:hypothetical protein
MENENNLQRIYDLLEKSDFEDLSPDDQKFVLSIMSGVQYNDMRNTCLQSIGLFQSERIEEPDPSVFRSLESKINTGKKAGFRQILFYPVAAYKVAAAIILLGIILFFEAKYNRNHMPLEANNLTDTFLIKQIDTCTLMIHDTVWVTGNRKNEGNKIIHHSTVKKPEVEQELTQDSYQGIKPDDIIRLTGYNSNSNLQNDSTSKVIIATLY